MLTQGIKSPCLPKRKGPSCSPLEQRSGSSSVIPSLRSLWWISSWRTPLPSLFSNAGRPIRHFIIFCFFSFLISASSFLRFFVSLLLFFYRFSLGFSALIFYFYFLLKILNSFIFEQILNSFIFEQIQIWKNLNLNKIEFEQIQIWTKSSLNKFKSEQIRIWTNSSLNKFEFEQIRVWTYFSNLNMKFEIEQISNWTSFNLNSFSK
jgi:hypothetical protein